MSILCNESTHLSNKLECQLKGLNWSISFIPGPFIGYQRPGDLLIRVLSWFSFSERGAGELSAGNTRIRSRANKNHSRKGGRIQGGVEAEANLGGSLILDGLACQVFSSWPRHGWGLGRPCLSGIFFMTSSRAGPTITAPDSNPLQCSCLENPRDGGASWAAIYRVAQSRTWLKQLSSSSSSSEQRGQILLSKQLQGILIDK